MNARSSELDLTQAS